MLYLSIVSYYMGQMGSDHFIWSYRPNRYISLFSWLLCSDLGGKLTNHYCSNYQWIVLQTIRKLCRSLFCFLPWSSKDSCKCHLLLHWGLDISCELLKGLRYCFERKPNLWSRRKRFGSTPSLRKWICLQSPHSYPDWSHQSQEHWP